MDEHVFEMLTPRVLQKTQRLIDDAIETCAALGYRDLHMGRRDGDWNVLHGVGHPSSTPPWHTGKPCFPIARWRWVRGGLTARVVYEFECKLEDYVRQQNWLDWVLA